MFDGIASRYDMLNRMIFLGSDQRWRRRAVNELLYDICKRGLVLDLATGTADLALLVAR